MAKILPISSLVTHLLNKVLMPTVHTGVKEAITKPKMNEISLFIKTGNNHPIAPVIQAKIRVIAS